MLHQTAQERYEKLKKVYLRLMQRFNRDDLDDFILTANSLPEWIRRDSTLSLDQKEALEKFVVPESLDWQICHQIANAQKHAGAKPRPKGRSASSAVVRSVDCQPGGTGVAVPPSMRVVAAGDEIVIEYNNHREPALGFVVRTFHHFRYIFEIAPIPVGQRGTPTLFLGV
jgi:hypothetical protein